MNRGVRAPEPPSSADLSMRYKRAAELASPVRSVVRDAFPIFHWLGSDRLLAALGCEILNEFSVQDGKRIELGESASLGELQANLEGDRATSPDGFCKMDTI